MEKLNVRLAGILAMIILLSVSCDKTKHATNKFIKEGQWTVTQLTAGVTEFTKLPNWQIYPCDDYDNHCTGLWEHQNGSSVIFYWQFSNIGGDFDFYVDPAASETTTMAYAQCYNIMGHYKVIEQKTKSFQFESEETVGYPGKLVTIKIEKG